MFEMLLFATTCKMLKSRRHGILNVTARMNIPAREAMEFSLNGSLNSGNMLNH